MAEFEYRGFRVRTIFEKDWKIRMWPPLRPAQAMDKIRASRAEGEHACLHRATRAIDDFMDKPAPSRGRVRSESLTE
ncbi:hypothetical protein [Pelagibacterium halotolerans]|uniref:Uncharacterized protein n=1 Tax=Pelagibacterium halotolerans (strain DSM 22347 / JCM 15775 / CGMCC 1.7692 / B2) TaxID=1082931 RepID=G4RCH5_PELHB|nr:hypothetical protein [Pelagibacterium halotolerans]AEQ50647.1 hypothetical protein KKY_608 [Pelagibacterium halotolerans B2]QJR19418.1 hypothetical protein HKM20_13790 [Pelagibacterium halotolerans]SDZ91990.1 hypothetical protein SAMN05428936_101537 [Pelagibacterium halotolerans]